MGHNTVTDTVIPHCGGNSHRLAGAQPVMCTHLWGFCQVILVSGIQARGGARTGVAGKCLLKEVTTV